MAEIKSGVTRKNYMDTFNRLYFATANAVLFTLVESAQASELDVYEYLTYLLT
ncbi:transposase domain-containing protein [Acetobacterium bakii]|uniref:transposase domain-containing protein n=1 Tax=Acetobacterium bakii TaxID=52689 RepID=UPI000F8E54D1|nr:transposase domain-containing protein [Acetobacterium bakii]